ncbi:MAG: C40 family peptidase [Nitrosomonadales bacterium]|nr:C40 family peptidase [Nitrosomonadales bacterium]
MNRSGFLFAALFASSLLGQPALAAPQESVPPSVVAAPEAETTPPQEPSIVDSLLGKANELIGTPYRNGGASPLTGFDCSGFVSYLFKSNLDVTLPRSSKDMSRVGESVEKDELKPGDLLFFKTVKRGISHVGIYMGNGQFIHSPWLGRSVEIAHLNYAYWSKRFVVAKRLDLPETESGKPSPQLAAVIKAVSNPQQGTTK